MLYRGGNAQDTYLLRLLFYQVSKSVSTSFNANSSNGHGVIGSAGPLKCDCSLRVHNKTSCMVQSAGRSMSRLKRCCVPKPQDEHGGRHSSTGSKSGLWTKGNLLLEPKGGQRPESRERLSLPSLRVITGRRLAMQQSKTVLRHHVPNGSRDSSI